MRQFWHLGFCVAMERKAETAGGYWTLWTILIYVFISCTLCNKKGSVALLEETVQILTLHSFYVSQKATKSNATQHLRMTMPAKQAEKLSCEKTFRKIGLTRNLLGNFDTIEEENRCHRWKPETVALREIRKYQKSTEPLSAFVKRAAGPHFPQWSIKQGTATTHEKKYFKPTKKSSTGHRNNSSLVLIDNNISLHPIEIPQEPKSSIRSLPRTKQLICKLCDLPSLPVTILDSHQICPSIWSLHPLQLSVWHHLFQMSYILAFDASDSKTVK